MKIERTIKMSKAEHDAIKKFYNLIATDSELSSYGFDDILSDVAESDNIDRTIFNIEYTDKEQAETPTFFVTKRPRSARPAKPVFRYYNTLSAFCQGKNDIKLHKNFPETLCNLPIAIRSKSDIIIIVQGEQKRTDNK